MIDTILFDLDNTLLDFDRGEKEALAETLTQMGTKPTREILDRYNVINLTQWKRLERGELSRDQLKVLRYQILFDEFQLPLSAERAAEIYECRLAREAYFMEGAKELLEILKGKYRMFVLTNGTEKIQSSRMELLDMKKYFEGCFVSETVGANKPSMEYFRYCFAHIEGFDPKRSVLIGDSLTSDILGGSRAGIPTIWFRAEGTPTIPGICPTWEIDSLEKIPSFLEEI